MQCQEAIRQDQTEKARAPAKAGADAAADKAPFSQAKDVAGVRVKARAKGSVRARAGAPAAVPAKAGETANS